MASTDLKQVLALPDPLPSFKWVAETIPNILGQAQPRNFKDYVEAVDLPFNNVKIADNWYGGAGYTYYPGTHDISSFAVTFYEDMNGTSLKYIMAWKALVKDFNSGIYNLPTVFKKDLVLLLQDIKNTPVVRVTMQGIWPADTGNLNLNYTDSGRITISQTFSCDGQSIEPLK